MMTMKKMIPLLFLIAPSIVMAQSAFKYQSSNPSVASTPSAPPPPPKKIKVMLSAFKPWSNYGSMQVKETNMAGLVADALVRTTRNQTMGRIDIIDDIDLEVHYDTSAEALIDRILNQREVPDMILSLGQGTSVLTIETGATQGPSDIKDGRGIGRTGAEFQGLETDLGFNFPVQDMYCSLPPGDRRKVGVSYTPGAFVCNDLSYYMANFSRGSAYAKQMIGQMEFDNERDLKNQMETLNKKISADLKSEQTRIAGLQDKIQQDRRNYEIALQGVRDRNNAKLAMGGQPKDLEAEPVFFNEDRSAQIQQAFQDQKRMTESRHAANKQRIEKLRNLFRLDKPIPFVFVHVPVSDGVQHKPVYKIENAMCLSSHLNLPSQSGLDWMEVSEASSKMSDSWSSIEGKAAGIVKRAIKEQEKNPTGYSSMSNAPLQDCLDKSVRYSNEVESSYFDEKTKQPVTIYKKLPPKARFVVALSASAARAEIREEGEVAQHTNLIIKMIEGAVAAQENNREFSEFPLPTFKNNKNFPRYSYQLSQVKDILNKMSKPTTRVQTHSSAITKDRKEWTEGVDFTTTVVPPQLTEERASCYVDFMEKVITDHRKDEQNKKSKTKQWF